MERERTRNRAKAAKRNSEITGNTMGDYLQDTRVAAGLSQRNVADALGHSTPQFISNWERNISEPPIDSLRKISKMYKISEVEFVAKCYQAKIRKAHKNIMDDFIKHYPYVANLGRKGNA